MWFFVCVPKEDPELSERSQSRSPDGDESEVFCDSKEYVSLKQSLKECLDSYGIANAVWCTTAEDKFYQVCFPCESGDATDCILRDLISRGIGARHDSSIGVLPCPIFYKHLADDATETPCSEEAVPRGDEDVKEERKRSTFRAMQKKFLKSVTARLTVAQVVAGVRAQGDLTFDYVAFVILAGMIAALGLMDNNVVSIIAAMLVSPLMGPIMAITFGIIIQDRFLVKVGLKTELLGLFLCLVFGFIFGLMNAFWGDIPPYQGTSWSPSRWPNPEMSSRGHWRSLWVGALVALPSGGGVAMAVLGGNAACLVGVAISASLLPPIINAGILWSLSLVKVFKSLTQDNVLINATGTLMSVPPAFVAPDGFQAFYFDNYSMHKECAMLGTVSFCLTIVNIVCIVVAGTLVLKIKEVAPATSLPGTRRFWKHDIKVARDYNKTLGGSSARTMGKKLLEEWSKIEGRGKTDPAYTSSCIQSLQGIIDEAEDDEVYQTVVQHVANRPPLSFVGHLSRSLSVPQEDTTTSAYGSRMNVWELESLLGESDRARRRPKVGFKLRRDRPQDSTHDEADPSGANDEKASPKRRRGLFRFGPTSRFQVTRVEEGLQEPDHFLTKMRRFYRSNPSPSS